MDGPWSPLQDVALAEVPSDGREHELTLYLEDTMWPYQEKFEDAIWHVDSGVASLTLPR